MLKSSQSRHTIGAELSQTLKSQKLLIAVVLIYVGSAFLVSQGISPKYNWLDGIEGITTATFIGPLFALCAYTIYVMAYIRPPRLTQFLLMSMRQYLTRARVLQAVPVIVLFPIFTTAFTYLKLAIPSIQPFTWDSRLAQIDLAIHGGTHPWEWLQYALGYPLISSIINIFYHLWFFIILSSIYLLAFDTTRPALRMRFLLSFILSWIVLGNVVATLFSSAGPCYYGQFVSGENPYNPLLLYLEEASKHVPLWSLKVQKMLWEEHQSNLAVLGISAMPSMHVASAVLVALLGARISRKAGIVLTSFAIIIMIGSIHLGWHYAVDGYIGAIGAYLIWLAVGWITSAAAQKSSIEFSSTQHATESFSNGGQP